MQEQVSVEQQGKVWYLLNVPGPWDFGSQFNEKRETEDDPLIPLKHSLIRRDAEGRWIPPVNEFFRAVGACARRYGVVEVLNDWRLCL